MSGSVCDESVSCPAAQCLIPPKPPPRIVYIPQTVRSPDFFAANAPEQACDRDVQLDSVSTAYPCKIHNTRHTTMVGLIEHVHIIFSMTYHSQ